MYRVNRTERNEARLLIGTASALLGLLSVVSCSDPLRGGRLGVGGATGRGGALGAGGLVGTGAGTIGGSSPTGGTTGAGGTTAAGDTPNTKLVAKAISASCAVLSDGTVQCWGHNSFGELGNGTTTASAVPVRVVGL